MQEKTKEKIINILQRPYKSLPVSIDLPRLASTFEIYKEGPDGAPRNLFSGGEDVLENLRNIFLILGEELQGPEFAQKIKSNFDVYIKTANSEVLPKALERLMEEVIGGDSSPLIRLLKSCNQATISPAVVELKFALGISYLTKDVKRSWRTVIFLTPERVHVITKKREQCVKNHFQFQWELMLIYDRAEMTCRIIDLIVSDLLLHEAVLHGEFQSKKAELRQIFNLYVEPPSVLDEASYKAWEFYKGSAAPAEVESAMMRGGMYATVSRSLAGKHSRANSVSAGSAIALSRMASASAASGGAPAAVASTSSVPSNVAPASSSAAAARDLTLSAPAIASASIAAASHTTNSSSGNNSSSTTTPQTNGKSSAHLSRSEGILSSTSPPVESSAAPSKPRVTKVQNYANGDRYEGEVNADGKRDGRGVYTTTEGDVYVGDYVAGNRHGKGVYTRKDGSRYEGEFRDGLPNGTGVYVYENGDIYTGTFKNDEFDGQGRWSNQKGDYYDGAFRAGKRNGFGTLVAKGNKYEGHWQDDLRHGRGRYAFKNGDVYDGEFLQGKFHGQGKYTFHASGQTVEAVFRNGQPIKTKGLTM